MIQFEAEGGPEENRGYEQGDANAKPFQVVHAVCNR